MAASLLAIPTGGTVVRNHSSRRKPEPEKRQGRMEMLGHTLLDLPQELQRGSLHLRTYRAPSAASLRHTLSGIKELGHYLRVELVKMNGQEVAGWSHTRLSCGLQDALHTVISKELELEVLALDKFDRKHKIDIKFDIIYDDGKSLGSHARALLDVILRVTDKILTRPEITQVEFMNSRQIQIAHAALSNQFMHVGERNVLGMHQLQSPHDSVFKCYTFLGHNERAARHEDPGEDWARLCVLQDLKSSKLVQVDWLSAQGRLVASGHKQVDTHIESITTLNTTFFFLHPSPNLGHDSFCLRPVETTDFYLYYDRLSGLMLKKCKPPPYKNASAVHQFTFTFFNAG